MPDCQPAFPSSSSCERNSDSSSCLTSFNDLPSCHIKHGSCRLPTIRVAVRRGACVGHCHARPRLF
ncbi:hypothetical protein Micbo1qcDRAFT_159584 [Microdochium bolleyi]|uniref:Uncharacterized protein n=1 Tax=Microdochium bolleyi TaxID=196109 RepID=A0A136JBB1_9PEZI|nr:hypothetical protein Micbo1qcDRAFT_159584 [Microdochium bolleyi]